MADDKNTGQYQFPGQGSKEEYGDSSVNGGTENVKSILTNKRVLVLIGIVVVGVLLWVINREESGDDDSVPAAIPVQSAPEVNQSPAEPITPQAEPDRAEPVVPQPVVHVNSPQLESDVNQISRRIDEYDVKINQLNQSIQQLNANNYDITQQLSKIARDIDELKPKPVKKVEPVAKKEPPKVFTIRAIIEGRAWIRAGLSDNLTVKVGDTVPTYGEVKGIFPSEGVITTTSGRHIVFQSND